MESEILKIIEGFRSHIDTEKGKAHLAWLREREPREVKEVLAKLEELPKKSDEFTDLVLNGLLPMYNTSFAKRVSISPSFMNIKKFYAYLRYNERDWNELSNLIFDLATKFQRNPELLEDEIRNFVSHRLSKGLQCGSLSPIFYALNQTYPMVNNRVMRSYQRLYFLVLGKTDKLSQKLEDYPSNMTKIKFLTKTMSEKYGFKEITDTSLFDLLCYWYDVQLKKDDRKQKPEKPDIRVQPIDEKLSIKFYEKQLTCSEPTPYFVAMGSSRDLQRLDEEGKIIFNTEFQRGEVWDTGRKQKLIDSILRGYNINTIFFRQLSNGKLECLDGQQRLKTILREFLKDTFPIDPKITPEFNRKTLFSELPEVLKSKIKSYQIFAILLYTEDDEETCRIFLRLQEGLSLNAAEKLNAMMGFLRNEIVQLTTHEFMKNIGINDYRFAHRYMLAQNYLLTLRNQIIDVKFPNLEEMYNTYKTTRPSQIVTDDVKKVLNLLNREFGIDAKTIVHRADFMSVFLLQRHIMTNYATYENTGLKGFFVDFMSKVGKAKSSEGENAPYFEYNTYRKTSADSKDSIRKRLDIIVSKFLEYNPNLHPKDSKRNFDYWEKLAIYRRDSGNCKICGKKTPFDKGTVDHIIPYSKGGLTTIQNGQWACVSCNLEKLDKTNPAILVSPALRAEISDLRSEIVKIIGDCNHIRSSKSKELIFPITIDMFARTADLDKPATTKDEFGNLIDALYEIVYEGSASLNRIPDSFKKDDFIGLTIKHLRTDLRHDLEHGDEKEILKKQARLAKIYEKYTGKTSMSSLTNGDFLKIHLELLKETNSFLKDLKQYCIES